MANGLIVVPARHCRALASPMAAAPLDQRSTRTRPGRPEHHCDHSDTRRPDDRGESSVGAPGVHGELGKLGIAVSERTVSRLLGRRRRPPSRTWRTFLADHVASLVSMRLLHSADPALAACCSCSSSHPPPPPNRSPSGHRTSHRTWTAQQIIEAFPNDTAPRWLLRITMPSTGTYPPPCRRHGHHGGHHRSIKSLARSVCGETDRSIGAMSGLRDRPRRAASATSPDRVVTSIMGTNTCGLGQGRADDTTRSAAYRRTGRKVP